MHLNMYVYVYVSWHLSARLTAMDISDKSNAHFVDSKYPICLQ